MAIPDRLNRTQLGALGEQMAAEFLAGLGWSILQRNWRSRYGELDIIAVDGATLVVVEVKTRTGDRFGGVEYAVTPDKLRRIRRLTGLWLAGQQVNWTQIRIDVLGIRFNRRSAPEFLHLRAVG